MEALLKREFVRSYIIFNVASPFLFYRESSITNERFASRKWLSIYRKKRPLTKFPTFH
jgi:hypothetical protein